MYAYYRAIWRAHISVPRLPPTNKSPKSITVKPYSFDGGGHVHENAVVETGVKNRFVPGARDPMTPAEGREVVTVIEVEEKDDSSDEEEVSESGRHPGGPRSIDGGGGIVFEDNEKEKESDSDFDDKEYSDDEFIFLYGDNDKESEEKSDEDGESEEKSNEEVDSEENSDEKVDSEEKPVNDRPSESGTDNTDTETRAKEKNDDDVVRETSGVVEEANVRDITDEVNREKEEEREQEEESDVDDFNAILFGLSYVDGESDGQDGNESSGADGEDAIIFDDDDDDVSEEEDLPKPDVPEGRQAPSGGLGFFDLLGVSDGDGSDQQFEDSESNTFTLPINSLFGNNQNDIDDDNIVFNTQSAIQERFQGSERSFDFGPFSVNSANPTSQEKSDTASENTNDAEPDFDYLATLFNLEENTNDVADERSTTTPKPKTTTTERSKPQR